MIELVKLSELKKLLSGLPANPWTFFKKFI